VEEWSSAGLRIEIDYLPGRDAAWSDDLIPEMIEPEVLSGFRVRVLERVDERSYRVATIEDFETEKIFHSPDGARAFAEQLQDHPEVSDAPIVDLLPEQFADPRA
jgi:hypothetical protein